MTADLQRPVRAHPDKELLLQTTDAARRWGVDDAAVCVASLHDVGQFLPDFMADEMLSEGVSIWKASRDYRCSLSGIAGLPAKRRFTASELQDSEVEAFGKNPLTKAKKNLRHPDAQSKRINIHGPSLETFRSAVENAYNAGIGI
ncbi:hypothetical protein R3P38DRAFT_3350187 [Favolaschia claudopus]|uniref:HD domain-containing protein n=1 Tax=Favolaschia claudopus TaxID=2862362 RepID=A0AAW0CFW5_9AGAR